MEYRRLGKSGLKISALSFGSWITFSNQVDTNLAVDLLSRAYDAGVNFFDNAEAYAQGQSETIMGEALKKMNKPRETYCVSSKVFWGGEAPTQLGLSRKHVTEACHAALKRLQVDHLDLYFCHRPDPDTPIEETVMAMHNLVTQGKVLYWGTSEWSAEEITMAHKVAKENYLTPPTMEQPQYSMLERKRFEVEYAKLYKKYGMGTTIWSPLKSGILTGKYNKGIPEGSRLSLKNYEWLKESIMSEQGQVQIETAKRMTLIANELNCKPAQLAIAWCLKNPNVSTVILGASKAEQLEENLGSLEVYQKLDDNVMKQIASILG